MKSETKKLYDYILNKEHHKFRKEISLAFDKNMTPIERMTYRFEEMCKAEIPVILEGEKIVFIRTVKNIPDIFSEDEWKEIKSKHYIHELGYMSNLSPNYERVIKNGLLKERENADEYGKRSKMIDPKINLRVNKKTPIEVYELGSRLTKAGLGFPQYSNDDIVIDGLKKLGYSEQDARDYVVAACWEFIIPKVGADVANIGALSFPKVVDTVLHGDLKNCTTFEEFENCMKAEIKKSCDEICDNIKDLWFVPSPFMNICMDCDIYTGGKYNNFGIHGSGVATAADSLEVIKKYVFEEKSVTAEELIEAVDSDFEKHSELLPKFRFETPKMGNDIDEVDNLAVKLLDWFADGLEGRKNCRGGVFRAGTGTAMYYLWHANEIGASPDGRRKGEPFGTNFSASLFAKINGPFSVVKSFTKPHYERAINGGPLTLEFHNSMFTDDDCINKVATLVKTFIDMGGHQLQLNAVNMEAMKDAQIHPENHKQLVVRIWGWSAYFVELDKEYQDHVMSRQEYIV